MSTLTFRYVCNTKCAFVTSKCSQPRIRQLSSDNNEQQLEMSEMSCC